jgi:hypothetical protein
MTREVKKNYMKNELIKESKYKKQGISGMKSKRCQPVWLIPEKSKSFPDWRELELAMCGFRKMAFERAKRCDLWLGGFISEINYFIHKFGSRKPVPPIWFELVRESRDYVMRMYDLVQTIVDDETEGEKLFYAGRLIGEIIRSEKIDDFTVENLKKALDELNIHIIGTSKWPEFKRPYWYEKDRKSVKELFSVKADAQYQGSKSNGKE